MSITSDSMKIILKNSWNTGASCIGLVAVLLLLGVGCTQSAARVERSLQKVEKDVSGGPPSGITRPDCKEYRDWLSKQDRAVPSAFKEGDRGKLPSDFPLPPRGSVLCGSYYGTVVVATRRLPSAISQYYGEELRRQRYTAGVGGGIVAVDVKIDFSREESFGDLLRSGRADGIISHHGRDGFYTITYNPATPRPPLADEDAEETCAGINSSYGYANYFSKDGDPAWIKGSTLPLPADFPSPPTGAEHCGALPRRGVVMYTASIAQTVVLDYYALDLEKSGYTITRYPNIKQAVVFSKGEARGVVGFSGPKQYQIEFSATSKSSEAARVTRSVHIKDCGGEPPFLSVRDGESVEIKNLDFKEHALVGLYRDRSRILIVPASGSVSVIPEFGGEDQDTVRYTCDNGEDSGGSIIAF